MCKCLKVSRNSYYCWKYKQTHPQVVSGKTALLKDRIKAIWEDSRKLYGSPKITEILKREGKNYSSPYVARLMHDMGIKSTAKRKYVTTTDSRHDYPVHENLLNRQFEVNDLGKVWVSDITYIRCGQSWLHFTD